VKVQKGGNLYAGTNRESVENEVLRILQESEKPYSVMRLIQLLKARGVRDSAVRAALWHLIDRTEVELADNWELRPLR
jgi:repressor of nif and glnA expression